MTGGCCVHRAPGTAKKAKPSRAALDEQEDRSRSVTRSLLIALMARVAFFLLPFLPLRVKNLVLISKVGLLLFIAVHILHKQARLSASQALLQTAPCQMALCMRKRLLERTRERLVKTTSMSAAASYTSGNAGERSVAESRRIKMPYGGVRASLQPDAHA